MNALLIGLKTIIWTALKSSLAHALNRETLPLNWFVIYPRKMKMKWSLTGRNCIRCVKITARIFFTFISSTRSSNIWISYIHYFILHYVTVHTLYITHTSILLHYILFKVYVLHIHACFLLCQGRNIDGKLRFRRTFSCGPPPEVVLFDRSVRYDRNLPFHFQKFSFPVPLHWEEVEILVET